MEEDFAYKDQLFSWKYKMDNLGSTRERERERERERASREI
jgi:hypothetical protein